MKSMNKKGFVHPLVLAIGFLASLITLLVAGGFIDLSQATASITGSGQYIERPVFSYIKCEAVSGLKYSTLEPLATSGQWLPRPSATDSYDVIVKTPKTLGITQISLYISGNKVEYYVCNSQVLSQSNCRIYSQNIISGSENKITGIKPTEYVWMQYQYATTLTLGKWREESGAYYQIGFIPYGLREYNVLSAPQGFVNPNDCKIPSIAQTRDAVLSTDGSKMASYISVNTNENVLQPNEVRWYVAGYTTSLSDSFLLKYNFQDAWCRDGKIYKVNTIKTSTGTYKVASADYSDFLGSVTCCPKQVQGDKVCSDKFIWETIAGTQCGAFKSCGSPNPVPYSAEKTIQYTCDNGYCKSIIKEVECASDYDCKDENKVCDTNKFKCVEANVNLIGQNIITIPDNLQDCQQQGGTWMKVTTEKKSLLNYVGIGSPKVIVNEYCEMDKPNNLVLWIALTFLFIALIFFFPKLMAGLRMLLAKVGVRL